MNNRTMRIVAATLAAIVLSVPLASCARKKAPAPTVHRVQYTVRAVIERVPAPGEAAPEIQARHEEIPSFVEKYGEAPTGMRAMTMPFPVGPGLKLGALAAGDKVWLTFEVDYSVETGLVEGWRAVAIRPLSESEAEGFDAGE
jgi:hypothetical protein